jgi:hypothetical protein
MVDTPRLGLNSNFLTGYVLPSTEPPAPSILFPPNFDKQQAYFFNPARTNPFPALGSTTPIDQAQSTDQTNTGATQVGSGIIDDAKDKFSDYKRRIVEFFGGRKQFEPKSLATLEHLGDKKVTGIEVCREPIQKYIQVVATLLTAGKIDEARKKYGYADLYHLWAYITLEGGYHVIYEKEQTIHVKQVSNNKQHEAAMYVPLPPNFNMTLYEMIEKSRKALGENYFHYTSEQYNCQQNVHSLLKESGLLSDPLRKFINQDIYSVYKEAGAEGLKKATHFITTAADKAAILVGHGEGGSDRIPLKDISNKPPRYTGDIRIQNYVRNHVYQGYLTMDAELASLYLNRPQGWERQFLTRVRDIGEEDQL